MMATDEVVTRLNTLRAEVVKFIKGLSDAEADRVGIHLVLGKMDITQWIEFFLLHEAHHLYKVMICLAAGNSLITH